MKHLSSKVIVLGLTLAMSGCAMFKDKLDTTRTASIKKVAIIGFEINQKQPTDNLHIGAITNMVKHNTINEAPEMKAMMTKSYETLRTSLENVTGWKVMTIDEMNKVQAWRNYVTEEMTALRSTWSAGQSYEQFVTAGTVDHYAVVHKMGQAKRDELAKALGVDAVISVIQHQDIDQSLFAFGHVSGDAAFEYTTRSSLMAYAPGSDQPVWQVSNIKGQPVSSDKFGRKERLTKISLAGTESSTSSTAALASKYTR